jgi:hypothetical protein
MRLAGVGTRNSAHSYSNTPVRNFADFFSLNLTPVPQAARNATTFLLPPELQSVKRAWTRSKLFSVAEKQESRIEIKRRGSQPPTETPADHFTARVRLEPLFQENDPDVWSAFALLVAQLAYGGEEGAELAYRFERFSQSE